MREGVSPLAVGGGARAIGVQEEHGAPLGIELEEPNPAERGAGGVAARRRRARSRDDAGRSEQIGVSREGVSARGDADARGSARGDVVARARGAGERARARARPRVRVTRRVERHRVSVRDDCPSRAKGTTPRRPRARTDQRGTPPGQASTRALKDANDRGGARRGTRAHDAAKPRGVGRDVSPPRRTGGNPRPADDPQSLARRFRVWDGARLADRRLSSSRKARVEPLWMPRPVLNGGEQCRPRASQRELSLRPAPGRRATGQVSSLLPSPRLWICMGPSQKALDQSEARICRFRAISPESKS